MYALTKFGDAGRRPTSRAVATCMKPSKSGANLVQPAFGLTPDKPLRKRPTPRSVKPLPAGFGVNPKESGLFSNNNGSIGFLGRPRLEEVVSVNSGAASVSAPVSTPLGASRVEGAVDLPSRWHELQLPFPRNRL